MYKRQIVEKTPFYATMGGQQGDKGQIRTADGVFQVEDTVKLPVSYTHLDVYKRQG